MSGSSTRVELVELSEDDSSDGPLGWIDRPRLCTEADAHAFLVRADDRSRAPVQYVRATP